MKYEHNKATDKANWVWSVKYNTANVSQCACVLPFAKHIVIWLPLDREIARLSLMICTYLLANMQAMCKIKTKS